MRRFGFEDRWAFDALEWGRSLLRQDSRRARGALPLGRRHPQLARQRQGDTRAVRDPPSGLRRHRPDGDGGRARRRRSGSGRVPRSARGHLHLGRVLRDADLPRPADRRVHVPAHPPAGDRRPLVPTPRVRHPGTSRPSGTGGNDTATTTSWASGSRGARIRSSTRCSSSRAAAARTSSWPWRATTTTTGAGSNRTAGRCARPASSRRWTRIATTSPGSLAEFTIAKEQYARLAKRLVQRSQRHVPGIGPTGCDVRDGIQRPPPDRRRPVRVQRPRRGGRRVRHGARRP